MRKAVIYWSMYTCIRLLFVHLFSDMSGRAWESFIGKRCTWIERGERREERKIIITMKRVTVNIGETYTYVQTYTLTHSHRFEAAFVCICVLNSRRAFLHSRVTSATVDTLHGLPRELFTLSISPLTLSLLLPSFLLSITVRRYYVFQWLCECRK